MGKYYIAYGSNLSVEQMAHRCPDSVIAGKGVLKDWRLAFGRHATIEPCEGAEVPVLVWYISDQDEVFLDRYEGYPKYYYKADLDVVITSLNGKDPAVLTAMVYIMTEIQKNGTPSPQYYYTIREGYKRFEFDLNILRRALWECWKGDEMAIWENDYYEEEFYDPYDPFWVPEGCEEPGMEENALDER